MLGRMYSRFFELKGWRFEMIEKSEASISFRVEGEFAYGMLKCEHGVHRLVRLSPFNSGNTRETSFAMVDVIPVLEQSQEVFIDTADLRIDVFRASGAGGQHVNTTDSAVRITHLPTGIVVSSQAGRSQHSNKENAMTVLQGKLVQMMIERNAAAVEDLRGVKTEMAWGNQIRSYVLHPYKMVKDHRTGYEVGDPDKVLDGDLEGLINEKLRMKD
jgi:peptide chain release factor 2